MDGDRMNYCHISEVFGYEQRLEALKTEIKRLIDAVTLKLEEVDNESNAEVNQKKLMIIVAELWRQFQAYEAKVTEMDTLQTEFAKVRAQNNFAAGLGQTFDLSVEDVKNEFIKLKEGVMRQQRKPFITSTED